MLGVSQGCINKILRRNQGRGRGGWSHETASVDPDPEESNMAAGLFGRSFVYVQGNAPPHIARDKAAFLDQQDAEVMDWPARSQDMNPIEHVWDHMPVWTRDMDDMTSPPCQGSSGR